MDDLWRLFNCVGNMRPFACEDPKTGELVSLTLSPQYCTLTVGTRQFYFIRETGAFDGYSVIDAE